MTINDIKRSAIFHKLDVVNATPTYTFFDKTDDDTAQAQLKKLQYVISRIPNVPNIYEFGTAKGHFGLLLHKLLKKFYLTTIDNDPRSLRSVIALRNVLKYNQHLTFRLSNSRRIKNLPRYNLVFVDGDKDEHGMKHEIELAFKSRSNIIVVNRHIEKDYRLDMQKWVNEVVIKYPDMYTWQPTSWDNDDKKGMIIFVRN